MYVSFSKLSARVFLMFHFVISCIHSDTNPLLGELDQNQVDLIARINENPPKYKLRFDKSSNSSNDCVIQTPLIDLNSPVGSSLAVLRHTLDYFLLSGERLSQMTKVYHDSNALVELLEEVGHFSWIFQMFNDVFL